MHTTMQTLGRVAIIGGGIIVALINVYIFTGAEQLPQSEMVRLYERIYLMALAIPFISVLGIGLAWILQRRHRNRLRRAGFTTDQADRMVKGRNDSSDPTHPNWWILGGSVVFVFFTLTVGLGSVPYSDVVVFAGSMAFVVFLMFRLTQVLVPD
jgi:hypothetical protein